MKSVLFEDHPFVFLPLSQRPRLGQHCSITSRSVFDTIQQAEYCTSVQISLGSMRSYNNPREINKSERKNIKKYCKKYDKTIYSHLPYVCNFGKDESDPITPKSIGRLIKEIDVCKELDMWTVLHPSAKGTKEKVVDILSHLDIDSCDRIVLENSAGQGLSPVMTSLDEIEYIMRRLPNTKLCIDTCHLFAAGVCDFTAKHIDQFFHDIDNIIGLNRLKLIHLNDSQKKFGSRVDRHENIALGEGCIWDKDIESLHILLYYARKHEIDLIIESDEDGEIDLICLHKLLASNRL